MAAAARAHLHDKRRAREARVCEVRGRAERREVQRVDEREREGGGEQAHGSWSKLDVSATIPSVPPS